MTSSKEQMNGTGRLFRAIAAAATGIALSACAASTEGQLSTVDDVNDPFEPANRVVFAFNEAVDTVVIRPVAVTYDTFVPEGIQQGITNFLRNLRTPIILANELLQGDWEGAEVAASRLFLNTTLGLGGFIDIAAYAQKEYQSEDFGQTLARWGVGEGPYLVLPILGPSNPRDAVGFATDVFADPVGYAATDGFNYARAGATVVDLRQQTLEATDELERSSIDYYATTRSLYRQYRLNQIGDGTGAEAMPDIPDFEDIPEDDGAPVIDDGSADQGAPGTAVPVASE